MPGNQFYVWSISIIKQVVSKMVQVLALTAYHLGSVPYDSNMWQ